MDDASRGLYIQRWGETSNPLYGDVHRYGTSHIGDTLDDSIIVDMTTTISVMMSQRFHAHDLLASLATKPIPRTMQCKKSVKLL